MAKFERDAIVSKIVAAQFRMAGSPERFLSDAEGVELKGLTTDTRE